jgi:hypothetical protein
MLLLQSRMVFLQEISVFLQLSWLEQFGIKWAFLTLKTVICRNYSFQKLIQLSKGNNVLYATASSIHVFLCRSNGANVAYLHLETPKIQEVFFPKLTQFSHENSVHLIWMVFFWGILVFLQLSWIGVFETRWASSTLKMEICRVYSFQKLTEFSQGHTVLDVAASKIDGFLWRDTCGSSTQLDRPI